MGGFFALPLKRKLLWFSVIQVIGAFILFAMIYDLGEQPFWVGRTAIFLAILGIGLLILILFFSRLSLRHIVPESIAFTLITLVLAAVTIDLLSLSFITLNHVINNLLLALLFPANYIVFRFIKKSIGSE